MPRSFLIGLSLAVCLSLSPASAQDTLPIVVIDQEQVLEQSKAGRAFIEAQEMRTKVLLEERKAIETELVAEERELARRRPDTDRETFRALADAFDRKASDARADQDQKAQDIAREFEADRKRFLDSLRPVMLDVMRRYGASAMLDARTVVLSDPSIDITGDVISRLDQLYDERNR